MGLYNLLNSVQIAVFGGTYDVYLDWIGQIIKFLITSVSSVGVGIILFSLVLKIVVLPFDIYQRISMRKQNIKMKENQERMEKLQKQYANNKDLYNQKVMEMYKESGISMFSSCLPMILSMVIFFVAIGAFNAYSQYSNIENYNTMVEAYNAKILEYAPDLDTEALYFKLLRQEKLNIALADLRKPDRLLVEYVYGICPKCLLNKKRKTLREASLLLGLTEDGAEKKLKNILNKLKKSIEE